MVMAMVTIKVETILMPASTMVRRVLDQASTALVALTAMVTDIRMLMQIGPHTQSELLMHSQLHLHNGTTPMVIFTEMNHSVQIQTRV